MNKSGAIGTRFTSDIIRFLRGNGFINAELRNQAGRYDLGDIVGIPGVVIECKGGRAAEVHGAQQRAAWLAETETERRNANAEIGLLVCKRKGVGSMRVGTHDAFLPLWALFVLTNAPLTKIDAQMRLIPMRTSLADAVRLLRTCGYGDPLNFAEVGDGFGFGAP
jgi:hypothetical protein